MIFLFLNNFIFYGYFILLRYPLRCFYIRYPVRERDIANDREVRG